jgi:hypothetical protein
MQETFFNNVLESMDEALQEREGKIEKRDCIA